MSDINESAFPQNDNSTFINEKGMTKLEYFSLKIFCAIMDADIQLERVPEIRKKCIEQAKLLLKEIEEASKENG